MTQFTPPPAPSEVEAFIGQVVTDLSATFSGVLVNVGRKLGLYQKMADLGACTSVALAEATGMRERYVRERLRPLLEQKIAAKGFVVLFWGDAGWVHFFSKRPGIHPADFRSMNMFVAAGDPAQADVMNAAGFHPVPLEYTDTYTGLETGMIDVVPTLPFYALSGQFYTITPHMLELRWVPLVGAIVVSRNAWESMPSDTREALMRAAKQTGEAIEDRSVQEGQESIEAMRKRGLQVHSVSPELEAEWRHAAEQYYPKIRGTVVPADAFDQVRNLVKEYRANRSAEVKKP